MRIIHSTHNSVLEHNVLNFKSQVITPKSKLYHYLPLKRFLNATIKAMAQAIITTIYIKSKKNPHNTHMPMIKQIISKIVFKTATSFPNNFILS